LNELGKLDLSDDIFELTFLNLQKPRGGADPKIGETVKKYLLKWFESNNKVLFFIASNERKQGRSRVALFNKWFNSLSLKYKERFEMIVQSFSDNKGENYIGFIFRKDYSKYNQLKTEISRVINKLESEK
jgi:hypothetical protein